MCVCVCLVAQSCPTFVIPCTVAHHAPLFMEFLMQEYWRGLPFPSSGHFPNPGIEPVSPAPPALAGRFFIPEPPGKLESLCTYTLITVRNLMRHNLI